ncbi:hypothetical protein THIOM_005037 [Candidatus Thiomargarita nelsonii]|uniref:Uncharacterized protein n=1 Tax=Candidatus Thiomargarita nelsonii TaxID=1003181 RepID=A0A176RUC6_9GAMM|nr:hypothetical protein THIOM_005037 [Candidatus Thiomargarita nelsonii]
MNIFHNGKISLRKAISNQLPIKTRHSISPVGTVAIPVQLFQPKKCVNGWTPLSMPSWLCSPRVC